METQSVDIQTRETRLPCGVRRNASHDQLVLPIGGPGQVPVSLCPGGGAGPCGNAATPFRRSAPRLACMTRPPAPLSMRRVGRDARLSAKRLRHGSRGGRTGATADGGAHQPFGAWCSDAEWGLPSWGRRTPGARNTVDAEGTFAEGHPRCGVGGLDLDPSKILLPFLRMRRPLSSRLRGT